MQNKIDEIKRLLPYVDVDTSSDLQPVVILVEHVDVADLVRTINQILSATERRGVSSPAPARKSKKSRKSKKRTPAPPSITQAGQITMIPQVEANSIIVIADEEGVAEVRRLVKQFDVENLIGPVRIVLEYAEAEEAIARLGQLLNAESGPSRANIMADPAGGALLVSGSVREVEKVRELMERGGAVAWGAVPTSEFTGTETARGLWDALHKLLKDLEAKGISHDLLASQGLVTPACGMGSMQEDQAQAILDLTAGVSELARAEYV